MKSSVDFYIGHRKILYLCLILDSFFPNGHFSLTDKEAALRKLTIWKLFFSQQSHDGRCDSPVADVFRNTIFFFLFWQLPFFLALKPETGEIEREREEREKVLKVFLLMCLAHFSQRQLTLLNVNTPSSSIEVSSATGSKPMFARLDSSLSTERNGHNIFFSLEVGIQMFRMMNHSPNT